MENEKKLTGRSEEEILRALDERLRVMEDAAARALNGPLHAVGGLIDGVAEKQWRYAAGETLCGGFLNRVMARAYSCSEVNASMGRICAAPTAGSCGILPAVLLTMQEARGLSRSEVIDALLTASGFGAVVMKNATVAGAEGGCQAECGVAAAMAAAAAVQLCGGTLPQMLSAFSHALSACMGLVCDPVAGAGAVRAAQRFAGGQRPGQRGSGAGGTGFSDPRRPGGGGDVPRGSSASAGTEGNRAGRHRCDRSRQGDRAGDSQRRVDHEVLSETRQGHRRPRA